MMAWPDRQALSSRGKPAAAGLPPESAATAGISGLGCLPGLPSSPRLTVRPHRSGNVTPRRISAASSRLAAGSPGAAMKRADC
jgi:hypothetical protein